MFGLVCFLVIRFTTTQDSYIKLRSVLATKTEIPISSSLVLECEAGGSPPPVIHWLRNGRHVDDSFKDIHSTIDIGILGLSFTRSKLFLDCVSPADEAVYTCVATNTFSQVRSESKVSIVNSQFFSPSEKCQVKRVGK